MRILWLLVCAVAACAQTITFSPQLTGKKGSQLTLWNVDVSAPGKTSISAADIYAIAAAHQVGHTDATLANQILTTKAGHSVLHYVVAGLGAGSAGTAIGALVKSQGLPDQATASQAATIAGTVAAGCAVLLPYVQKEVPVTPNPVITAELLGAEMKLGSGGAGSALFYSLPSNVGAFTEVLK